MTNTKVIEYIAKPLRDHFPQRFFLYTYILLIASNSSCTLTCV